MNAPTVVPSTMMNVDEGEKKNDEKKNNVTILQLLRQHRLLAGMLLAFANGCVYNVFEPTLTVRLSTEWGYDSSQIGLIFLAQVIPTFIATPVSGIISDRYGPKVVCFTNLLICAITMFVIGIPSNKTAGGIVPLIVVFAIQGFTAFAFITPVLSEMAYVVQEQNPEGGDSGQGMSYALFNIAFALGGLVGPLVGGFMYSSIGFFNMCIVVGCFLLLCVPYVYVYTGGRGKFIVRPQDRKIAESEEEKIEVSDPMTSAEGRQEENIEEIQMAEETDVPLKDSNAITSTEKK
ncbi:unnamed protein product [Mucor hiemalis]